MPYSSNSDLPDAVKKLSDSLQTAWRKAFNSAYDSYKGDEQKAFAVAWAQVNKMRENTIHPSFLRVLDLFLGRYGEEGNEKFNSFVLNNGLRVDRPYNPRAQFSEAFSWAEPRIRFMKEDKGARYYAIRALHAIVSMNRNDYTDLEKLEKAAVSMNHRPININHDHSRWAPYPRTRVDFAKAEDMCVELILRVDNEERYLQMQLDHDPSIPEKEWINHPSIEGRPLAGGKEEGYHFMALALLEKGYQLPGDPLSEIIPIMFEGVQGGEVCMMVNGEKICLECEGNLAEAQALSENTLKNEQEDSKSMSKDEAYASGEINKEGAICPNCGHIVDMEDINNPADVSCPNCGAEMVRRPQKTIEQLSEFSKEEIMELFRPPFNGDLDSYHKRFTKTKGEDLVSTDIPTVPVVKGKRIGLVEHQDALAEKDKRIAELTSDVVSTEKKIATLTSQLSELKADYDEAIEKLADKTREASRVDEFKARTGDLTEDLIEKDSIIKERQKKIEDLERIIHSKEVRHERLSKELKELKEEFEALKVENENIRLERNDLSVKARGSEEKALNETRERSRIQAENAKYLDDKRKLTAEISKLSEKLAEAAKKNLSQEVEISQLEEKVRLTEEANLEKINSLKNTIEEAKKFHSWAWGKLKEAGYAIVQE